MKFQSTPPVEGGDVRICAKISLYKFQSTPPVEGGDDQAQAHSRQDSQDFNPRHPWRVATKYFLPSYPVKQISIHATRGGWRHLCYCGLGGRTRNFNPRHPWRVATADMIALLETDLFQSTPPVEGGDCKNHQNYSDDFHKTNNLLVFSRKLAQNTSQKIRHLTEYHCNSIENSGAKRQRIPVHLRLAPPTHTISTPSGS